VKADDPDEIMETWAPAADDRTKDLLRSLLLGHVTGLNEEGAAIRHQLEAMDRDEVVIVAGHALIVASTNMLAMSRLDSTLGDSTQIG
jgi:hypothetical protein